MVAPALVAPALVAPAWESPALVVLGQNNERFKYIVLMNPLWGCPFNYRVELLLRAHYWQTEETLLDWEYQGFASSVDSFAQALALSQEVVALQSFFEVGVHILDLSQVDQRGVVHNQLLGGPHMVVADGTPDSC